MKANVNKEVAEQATGIYETGLQLWCAGKKIKEKNARSLLLKGKEIAVPGAGTGSSAEVFSMLGFEEIKEIESSSSTGNWSFGVKDKEGWRLVWQTNRYPHFGFNYSVNIEERFNSFKDLIEYYNYIMAK